MELWFIIIAIIVLSLFCGWIRSGLDEYNKSLIEQLQVEFPNAKVHFCNEDSSYLVIDFDNLRIIVGFLIKNKR